jgi:hypothetical protein
MAVSSAGAPFQKKKKRDITTIVFICLDENHLLLLVGTDQ